MADIEIIITFAKDENAEGKYKITITQKPADLRENTDLSANTTLKIVMKDEINTDKHDIDFNFKLRDFMEFTRDTSLKNRQPKVYDLITKITDSLSTFYVWEKEKRERSLQTAV